MVRWSILLGIVVAALTASSAGATVSMVCQNPREAYSVTFDTGTRAFIVASATGKSSYFPLSFENGGKTAVSGMVGNKSGLGFYAEFSPKRRIELYSDDKLVQTDTCQ